MNVIYHLLIACSSVAVMAALWVGVQALVRRGSPELGEDEDVLACRTCAAGGSCGGCVHATKSRVRSDAEEIETLSM